MKKHFNFSKLIAGCMNWGKWGAGFTTVQYLQLIEESLAAGITSFDHADIYGGYTTESEFGQALKQKPSLRQQMQLITKCGIKMLAAERPGNKIKSYNTSKEYIIQSAEQSLLNLQTDYLDLLLIHRPDPLMNPDEIAEAFLQLKKEGKVLHFGVSNFTPSKTSLLHSRFIVEVNQVEISLLHLDPFLNGQLDHCIENNIIPMAWSPLGGGKLNAPEKDGKIKRILSVAEKLGKKYAAEPEDILFAFLAKHPAGILPVAGTTKISRLQSALKAIEINIEREEWFMLWSASTGNEVA
jgi:predicted oxidoreductase